MAENNQNSLVTNIATYVSFIAIASFVILFISIFLKFHLISSLHQQL